MNKTFFRELFSAVVFVCLANSLGAAALSEKDIGDLSRDPRWLRLGHYARRWTGGWKSRQDDQRFFLSPKGKTSPEAELAAAEAAFRGADFSDESAICRFPARYAWLREMRPDVFPTLSDDACPEFRRWRERLDAGSATLVFASSYMSNPASMYGHTFLRLDRRGRGETERLNDYCVNFAADTATRNGVAFALLGLTGGYDGKFYTVPFYMQVQKYNNLESRDLWEYDLNLSPAALEQILRHLWEMGRARFDYYFMTENCSFALLPLLETGDISLDLSTGFILKVIPGDTVKTVLRSGLVKGRRLRPSALRTALARREMLSPDERKWAEGVGREKIKAPFPGVENFPPKRRALVLDSAEDLFRLRHDFARFQTDAVEGAEREILLERGRVPVSPDDVPRPVVAENRPPEDGHPSGRVSIGWGRDRGRSFEEISYRAALQDLLNDPTGYVPFSELEMGNFVLRRDEERDKVYFQKLTLVNVSSLVPWDPWIRPASWNAFLRFRAASERGSLPENSLIFEAGYGRGLSRRLGNSGPLIYAVPGGDVGLGGILNRGFNMSAGFKTGIVYSPFKFWRVHADGGWKRDFWGDVLSVTEARLAQSFSLPYNMELRAGLERNGSVREGAVSMNYYF